MPAILDPDVLSQAQQLDASGQAPAAPAVAPAPVASGPILDPDVIEHARNLPADSSPAVTVTPVAADPTNGQVMQATPPKSWGQTADDYARMVANGVPFMDRIAAGLETLTGTGKPGADYAGNLEMERGRNQALNAEHPTLSKALGFGGGAAATLATAPEGAVAAGATLAEKALAGMGTGAAYGAAQGASGAPDLTNVPDAARRTAEGAAIGATAGAALPIAAGGIGAGYSTVADLLNGGVDGMSRAAASKLLPAVAADTPQAILAARARLGDQGMLADAGPALLGKAQGAALNSDEGRSVMNTALAARDAGTNARLAGDLNAALGPAQSPQAVTNGIAAQRTAIHAPLDQIFASAPPVDTSNALAMIGQRLNTARGPEQAVLAKARDYLMQDGQDAAGNPIRVPVTDAQTLQNAKMAIDTLIDRGDPSLGVPAGAVSKAQGSIGAVRGALNGALRQQVPGYANVMDQSSALAGGADAIDTGNSILASGQNAVHPADLNAQMQTMTPQQLAGLRIGARGAIDRTVGTKANDLVALRNALQGEGGWNDAKLSSIFGAGPVSDVANSIDRNTAFRNTNQAVTQNSQTAQRQAAAASMKPGADTGGIPLINPNASFTGMLATALKRGAGSVLNQIRPDPTRSYGEVARVLSAQGPQGDAYTAALINALQRRGQNAATGQAVGNRAAMAAALIGGRLANDQLQPQ